MPTGDFWNVEDPAKPWGPFDPDANLVFPIEIADWLAEMATAYASHQVIVPAPLECLNSSHNAGIISVRMALVASPTFKSGTKYPFTIRLVGADGSQDDRTLLLKVLSR